MRSGKVWVIGIFAVAGAMGLAAVLYWTRPETRVRWSFTQIHASLVRNRPEVARQFVSSRVSLLGEEMSGDDFLRRYRLSPTSGPLALAVCPSRPEHRTVALEATLYCFSLEGKLWKLHWVGNGPCACR